MLDSGELERLSAELYADRIIVTSLYCAQCGYNLRTLPYVYRCPECGSDYNARALKMDGIFFPDLGFFPFGDLVSACFCVAAAVYPVVSGIVLTAATGPERPPSPPGVTLFTTAAGSYSIGGFWLVSAAAFVTLAAVFARKAYRQLIVFFRARMILRQIAKEKEAE